MKKSSRRPKKTLKEPESFEHGYNYSIFLLGLRMRTEGEIAEKMKQRGYNEQVIADVIKQLLENRYINDQEYADVYLRNFKDYQTYGLYMIRKKMMEKKLPPELIQSTLDEGLSEEDEYEVAKRYAEKKASIKEIRAWPYEDKQKFMQKLLGRGFRISVVTKLVK